MEKGKKEAKHFIKKNIENWRNRKYQLVLSPSYEDNRAIEFTQGEADDLIDELENKPEKKFSITLPPEYLEILDDIARRDSKRWKLVRLSRNNIIKFLFFYT